MAIKILDKPNTEGISYDYPYGNIKDNPGDNTGTPVNKLVYADFHQFFAKMMDDAGISYNGLPDNATDGFQYWLALVKVIEDNCAFYTDISASVTTNAAFGVINKSVRQYTDGTVSVKLSGITSSSITASPGSGVQIASGLPDGHLVFINANMTKAPDVTPVSSFFQTDGVIGLYENIGSGLIWSLSFTYKKS
jgi:hypothetical protein